MFSYVPCFPVFSLFPSKFGLCSQVHLIKCPSSHVNIMRKPVYDVFDQPELLHSLIMVMKMCMYQEQCSPFIAPMLGDHRNELCYR